MIGHAVADFGLQSPWMSENKRRGGEMWGLVLSAHGLIHAGAVYLITGNVWLSVGEFAAHWLIDLGKGEGLYGVGIDQTLHILSKVIWMLLYIKGAMK